MNPGAGAAAEERPKKPKKRKKRPNKQKENHKRFGRQQNKKAA